MLLQYLRFYRKKERKVRKWIGPGHEERMVNCSEYVATNLLHLFLFERLRSCAEEGIPNEESKNQTRHDTMQDNASNTSGMNCMRQILVSPVSSL